MVNAALSIIITALEKKKYTRDRWVRVNLKMDNIFGNISAMVIFYISQYYIEKHLM